mgnify:FL=1
MKVYSTLILLLASLGLVACDSDNDPTSPARPDPVSFADVQVLHGSADAPAVDVLVDGAVAVSALDYKASSGWIELPEGTYSIEVQGILPDGNATVIGPVDLQFDGVTRYTVAAVNDVATIEAVLLEQPRVAVSAGSARLFVLHGSAAAPTVDVYVTAPDADLTAEAPVGTFSFKETIGPAEVPAGDYQIRVTAAGDPAAVVYDSGTITLNDADDFVVAAVPNTSGGTAAINLVALDRNGATELFDVNTPAYLRVGHLSPDTPAVDVYANAAPLLTDVAYPAITDILELPEPGTYAVEVAVAGQYPAGVAIGPADIELDAGTTTDVLAVNLLASIEALVLSDDRRQVATNAKVRIIHASPSAGNVDIYVTAPDADITAETPLLTDVPFKANTGYLSLAAGDYEVNVTPAGDNTTVAIGPVPLTVLDSGVYTAIARDPLPGANEFALELLLDWPEAQP